MTPSFVSLVRTFCSLAALAVAVGCTAPAPVAPTSSVSVSATATPSSASVVTTLPGQPPAAATASVGAAAPTSEQFSADLRVRYAEARLLLVEGDYAAAADAWRSLLTVILALSLSLAGRGSEALDALASGGPDSRDAVPRAFALDALNQHPQAMRSLADYASANPSVAPAVLLELAERELTARRPREAADAAARAVDAAQPRPLKQRLLDVRAQALAALGDNESAFDAHRQVLALATSTGALGEQLFHLAQVSRDLGKPDAALQALTTALEQFPSASTTADALRLLDELGAANQLDPFVLGRARYFAVDYRNAVTAFDRYLASQPDGPDAPTARLYRALASLTPGNEPNALRELDALADDPNQDSDIAAQGLLEAGQALESLSEPDQSEVRYQKLLDRFPRLDAAATAGFRLGLVRYERGADTDAISAWEGLIDLSSSFW